jgi:zinc transport system ATP-binding protein
MIDNIITLEHVAIGYGGQAIVSDISLTIARGSFTALLGANGSGKSTLLKTLIGVLPPVSGQVQFNPVGAHRVVVGYVPQRETLDPMFLLSSFEVALMGCYGRVIPGPFLPKAEREWTRECLRQVGASGLESKRFSELSAGQKQRVLIARALVARPDLLVLDEPTAGIDAAATQAILDVLRQQRSEERLTTLMVSHDLHEMREVAGNVSWLHHGRVLQGAVEDLLSPQHIQQMLELQIV